MNRLTNCVICNRKFGKIRHAAKGLCGACYTYEKSKGKKRECRTLFYPTHCIQCGGKFKSSKHRGLCVNCFNKTPERRLKMYEYTRIWQMKNPEKVKLLRHKNYLNYLKRKKELI